MSSNSIIIVAGQKTQETQVSGIEYETTELIIPPNVTDSNTKNYGELIDTIADRNLSAVVMKLHETMIPQDDLIAVSLGTDEDLATDFSVRVSGKGGLTGDLSLKTADGGVKFKDASLTLANGVESKTKLWGTSPSSAQNLTLIKVTLKEGTTVLGSFDEDSTVFKGVNIEFDGDFVANVNSIPEGWRPNSSVPAQTVAAGQDVQEYVGFFQFQDGDQYNKRRGWTIAPNVTIQKVETVDPKIVLGSDIEVLQGSEISAESGFLQPGATNPRSNEHIKSFKIKLREKSGGDLYATASIDPSKETHHFTHPAGDLASLLGWKIKADIEAKIDADTAGADIKSYYKSKWGDVDFFLKIRQQWKNRDLVFKKELGTKKSIVIKGMLGAQEVKTTPVSAIKMDIQRYNIWYLKGDLENGILTSETLP